MSKKLKTAAPSKTELLLEKLNKQYLNIHRRYEKFFWLSYMGDHSVNDRFQKAQIARENFRSNAKLASEVTKALLSANSKQAVKLQQWSWFFSKYQTPTSVRPIFAEIVSLEKKIHKTQTTRKEGYINPVTKKFTKASRSQMSDIMSTNDDEKVRKACFLALEDLAVLCTKDFVKLVELRNQYAQALGFEDFYAYKIQTEEDMTKAELFEIFDTIYDKTKYAFKDLHKMEKKLPGLRQPWNRGYLLAGDFTKESDQYYPFTEALTRWGESFSRLGIDFAGGTLQLDLLERKGKYENGFCHWPDLVNYQNGVRQPAAANFTCNVVYGQVGSAEDGYNTLFHEGGHAAHLLNSTQTEVCVNNEYPPASTAWDETQSMFLDSMLSSIEWATTYAKNAEGEAYPISLFERELDKLHALSPLSMNGISSVMAFEKEVYEVKNLTETKLKKIARSVYTKYTDSAVPSYRLLSIPHIYSWESSCAYQGYGLAQLAVAQWRDYFYKKFDYIVDNPKVGKELKKMWTYGSALPFPECVKLATGKKLSPQAFLKAVTASKSTVKNRASKKITKQASLKQKKTNCDMKATIKMVHGKKVIASNKSSFAKMSDRYGKWLKSERNTNI